MVSQPYALVVECRPVAASLYCGLLQEEGLPVTLLRDGALAVEHMKTHGAPRLLLANVSLPHVDGFSVVRELRLLADAARAPAILVAGDHELRNVVRLLAHGLGIGGVLAPEQTSAQVRRVVQGALHGALPSSENIHPEALAQDREARRLAALAASHLVEQDNAPQDPRLKSLLMHVALRFGVPVAVVSLVNGTRQWFKAHVGLHGRLLEQRGCAVEESFCRHVVHGQGPLVVPDAAHHPAFRDNPLVREGLVGGYAGAPLTSPGGEILGTLCILDTHALELDASGLDELVWLARHAAGELELSVHPTALHHPQVQQPGEPAASLDSHPLAGVLDGLETSLLVSNAAREVLFINRPFSNAAHTLPDAAKGMSRDALMRLHFQHTTNANAVMEVLNAGPTGLFAAREEIELAAPPRTILRWVAKPVRLGHGLAQLETLSDITPEHEARAALQQLAYVDHLTNLANRRAGEEAVAREMTRRQRTGTNLAFGMVDIDHFKLFNDRHGHALGDQVLQAVAGVIQSVVRGMDQAVRWGGEEFLTILPSVDLAAAALVGERIRASVEALVLPAGMHVTVSVGIAVVREGEDASHAIGRADAQLYEAKRTGRNRVCAA